MSGDWNALCRQIQPYLQAIEPERLNKLIQKNPMAKGLPEVPVKKREPKPSRKPEARLRKE